MIQKEKEKKAKTVYQTCFYIPNFHYRYQASGIAF